MTQVHHCQQIRVPRHLKVQSSGLASFNVNVMLLLLLLLFGQTMLQTGQKVTK